MPNYYTSFQVTNTTDDPITLSVSDPDGNVLTVGTLDPGKESLQVAPINASWSIELSDPTPLDNMVSPTQARQTIIAPNNPQIETRYETFPQLPEDMANSNPIHYEAFLKIETGSHSSQIKQLLVTPDNKTLISVGGVNTIRVWDIESKKQVGMLLGEIGAGSDGEIQAIALSRDGRYIVALAWRNPPGAHDDSDRETDVRVYELATGNLQAGFRYPGQLQDLDFTPDGDYLAMVGNPKGKVRRGYVLVYDTKDIVKGFGKAPSPIASNKLFDHDALIPAYVRCIPDGQEMSTGYRIVVATWYDPESQGRLLWYSFSNKGRLKNIANAKLPVRPESLTTSREFAVVTGDLASPDDIKIKSFFCYDHDGNFRTSVLSDSRPAKPMFSQNGSQLIVGHRDAGSLVQVKVYDTASGQFQLKSTYYGHDSDVHAVVFCQNGTAVSAGGDQNEIHFWNTAYIEGERTGVIKGMGRVVHTVGIKQSDNEIEQIGFGNRHYLRLEDGSIVLQRAFDLHSKTLKSLPVQEAATFRRAKTQMGELSMEWRESENDASLWLLSPPKSSRLLTGMPDPEKFDSFIGYKATTFGFTENLTIITGDSEGNVRVAPQRPDQTYAKFPWRVLVGHQARVLDHATCDKWLVTAGADQVIRLWYLEDVEQQNTMEELEPALNLFVTADDEWVLWSKSGYYMASQNGDRYLGYHVNRGPEKEALYFSSDRFHNVFFRPDIIQAILSEGSEERVFAKWAKSGITTSSVNVGEILPPIIELDEDGVKEYESEDKEEGFVSFTLTVQSHGKPITRLCVLRNGRLLHVEKSVPTYGKLTISGLPLLPGENRFKIFAENQDAQSNAIKSNPIEYIIAGKARYDDEDVIQNGMLYILAIGVSAAINLKKRTRDDEEGFFELNYAAKDANAVFDAVTKDNKAFEGVEKTLLLNEQATLEGIKKALDEIGQKINARVEERITNQEAAKRDVLLVYLSGHGVFRIKNQQLYFWNYDFDLEKPGDTGLAFMDLGEKITSLPAEVILMTDACHSGMVGSDVVKGYDPDKNGIDPNELAKRIYGINESDMYIFNAARRSESALEGRSVEHGYFTKAILDALLESTNLGVTMIGLIDQVQWGVQRYTNAQNPVCRMYGDLLPLVIYKK